MKTFEEKVSSMKFDAGDLEGGHFTISNLGMYGVQGARFLTIIKQLIEMPDIFIDGGANAA